MMKPKIHKTENNDETESRETATHFDNYIRRNKTRLKY